jgi:hypothetical protein
VNESKILEYSSLLYYITYSKLQKHSITFQKIRKIKLKLVPKMNEYEFLQKIYKLNIFFCNFLIQILLNMD